MPNIIKKITLLCVVFVILVAGAYYFLYQNTRQKKEQQIVQQEIDTKANIANELVNKYQAVTDWEENNMYTIQMQDRFTPGKPALFKGSIIDIYRINGKKYFKLASSIFSYQVKYYLELECDNNDIIDKIIAQEKTLLSQFHDYYVVASISGITRPIYSLKGSAVSQDEVEINIEPSEYFTLRGTCLEIADSE